MDLVIVFSAKEEKGGGRRAIEGEKKEKRPIPMSETYLAKPKDGLVFFCLCCVFKLFLL